jgi:hypothetical protein
MSSVGRDSRGLGLIRRRLFLSRSEVRIIVVRGAVIEALVLCFPNVLRYHQVVNLFPADPSSCPTLPGWELSEQCLAIAEAQSKPEKEIVFSVIELTVDECDGVSTCTREPGVFGRRQEVQDSEDQLDWESRERT